jgi:NitT/TauT family transport system substrate-binding protein
MPQDDKRVRMLGHGHHLLVGLALLMGACAPEPSPPMRIGTSPWPAGEILFLARQQNLLDERSFRLVEFSNSSEINRAFRNRTIEVAALTMDEVLYTVQNGMDPVIILVQDESRGADALLARPECKNLAALKGKRIAVEPGSIGAYFLTRALQHGGLTLKDVVPVHLPLEAHLRAYREGRVDAVVTYEPERSKLLEQGAEVLFDSRRLPGEIVDVLVVRRDYLVGHPERLTQLRRAWFSARAYLEHSRNAAIQIMAAREHVSPVEFEAMLHGLHLPDEVENRTLLGGPAPQLLPAATRLQNVMSEAGLLRGVVPVRPMFEWPAGVKEQWEQSL